MNVRTEDMELAVHLEGIIEGLQTNPLFLKYEIRDPEGNKPNVNVLGNTEEQTKHIIERLSFYRDKLLNGEDANSTELNQLLILVQAEFMNLNKLKVKINEKEN